MKKNMTFHKKKIWVVFVCCILMMSGLIGRLVYLMCFRSDHYYEKAKDLHERERDIKAARGKILDAKGNVLKQDSLYDFCDPQSDQRAGKGDCFIDSETENG